MKNNHWRSAIVASAMFCAFGLRPALASSVTATLGDGTISTTPGQLISASHPDTFEEALANYGLVRALSQTENPNGDANATAQFDVDFTLSNAATLAIGFHYDVNLTLDYPGSAGYKFGIATTSTSNTILDPGQTAWTYLATGKTSGGLGDDHSDECPEFSGVQPVGTCAIHHGDDGVLMVPFTAGPNHLEVALFTSSFKGAGADGFNTGEITGITVPGGVTFTYVGVNGNPLNVQSAGATPEPASLVLTGAALVLAGLIRRRRRA